MRVLTSKTTNSSDKITLLIRTRAGRVMGLTDACLAKQNHSDWKLAKSLVQYHNRRISLIFPFYYFRTATSSMTPSSFTTVSILFSDTDPGLSLRFPGATNKGASFFGFFSAGELSSDEDTTGDSFRFPADDGLEFSSLTDKSMELFFGPLLVVLKKELNSV
mmetsp:Transcript_113114/g.326816  ORF Transcript_113114/g.326816 Transcript_113114/m.326816 type:complete len:162 (-) Transcript_113114:2061-2546(-)